MVGVNGVRSAAGRAVRLIGALAVMVPAAAPAAVVETPVPGAEAPLPPQVAVIVPVPPVPGIGPSGPLDAGLLPRDGLLILLPPKTLTEIDLFGAAGIAAGAVPPR
jgi:hypothetical protein